MPDLLQQPRRLVADRFKGDRVESLDAVQNGEGRLLVLEGEQVAAYREENGTLHVMSPKCTHMGCTVQWNSVEQTWDCPCHGGRYSACGDRIYGPPPQNLGEPEHLKKSSHQD